MGVRQPATDVTKTTAVLNGKVLSTTGGRGSYFIEYGPDTARELKTPTRPIDFVNGESTPVVEPVDGLEPETTYHFAVCAEDSENPGDAFCSPDQTFTTDPPGTDRFTTAQSPFPGSLRNQGWWSPTSSNHDVNPNYIAGSYDGDNRNFFSFDLSSACQATEVTLQLTRFRQTGSLTYSLFDVSTPAAVLNANNGTSQAIFDDLGSGTAFGSFPVDPGAETDILSFRLNPAGVAGFNAARGGFFSIGGRSSGRAAPRRATSSDSATSAATRSSSSIAVPTRPHRFPEAPPGRDPCPGRASR